MKQVGLIAFALLALCLAGCGGGTYDADQAVTKPGNVRLVGADKEQIKFCYILVRSDVAAQLELSGYQRAVLSAYGQRLRGILTYYGKQEGDPLGPLTDGLNDLSKKVPRTLELAAQIQTLLEPEQIELFEQAYRSLKLKPIVPVLGEMHYVLKYRLKGDEPVKEVKLPNGKKMKVVLIGDHADYKEWATWLDDGLDVYQAMQSENQSIRRAGIWAVTSLPLADAAPDERALLAEALWDSIEHPKKLGYGRAEAIAAFAQLADSSQKDAILKLVAESKGREFSNAFCGLCRLAPDEAVALAYASADEFIAFSGFLKGFELWGESAIPLLIDLDKRLGGKQRGWIQRTLKKLGSTTMLEN